MSIAELDKSNTVISYFFKYSKQMRLGMFLILCRVMVVAPIPWIFKIIIDQNVASGDVAGIFVFVFVAIGLLLLHYALGVAGVKNIGMVTAGMIRDMRTMVFNRMQFLSFGYLDKNATGKLIAKYTIDTQKVQDTLVVVSEKVVPDMFYGIATLLVLISLDWQLSIVVLLIIPVYFLLRLYFWEMLKNSHNEVKVAQENLTGKVSELISALRFLRSMGEEEKPEQRLRQDNDDLALANYEMLGTKTVFWTTMFVVTQVLSLVIVSGGAYLVITGSMSIGTLVAYLAALPILLLPIDTLTVFSDFYYRGEVSYQSIRELANSDYVENWNGKKTLKSFKGEIHFEDVNFCYPTKPDERVLKSFTLRIKAGESVALVGASGSGKSTITNLILGLYDVETGSIEIDGVPLSQLSMSWFRQQCAIVMQDTILLSGSIMDNLRFAKENATDEEVFEAARAANAEDFILKFTDGYQTIVGERGHGLSGGQRQRISIARAILRDPRILILDEATSALDNESEFLIQQALEEITRNRTVITIAHRLTTVRSADRIVVLGDGQILEQGTFEELAENNGYFKRLNEVKAPKPAVKELDPV